MNHLSLCLRSLVLVTCFGATSAWADQPTRVVHVIEQRPFIQRIRLEVVPTYGYTINETQFAYHNVGGDMRFHITEEIALSGSFKYAFSSVKGQIDDLQEDFEVFPEKRPLRWFAGGELNYTPFY